MVKKIFSGVQPTGNLHLGNYLGAIKNFVDLSNDTENECVFCVVDLHAITVNQDPKKLRDNIRETVATFVASGIDPKRSVIFNQSQVSAHSEAAWILSCVARMGWLNRMTQFKEKAGKDKEKASVGLYSYPILMAADILLYDTTHVPVGDDQKQHLELCRDIAQKFNNDFQVEDFFKVPEPLIQKEFSRIMSLKDGLKKMSKSDPSDLSRINLTDNKDQIINKIKKAKTDPMPMPSEEADLSKRPEAAKSALISVKVLVVVTTAGVSATAAPPLARLRSEKATVILSASSSPTIKSSESPEILPSSSLMPLNSVSSAIRSISVARLANSLFKFATSVLVWLVWFKA